MTELVLKTDIKKEKMDALLHFLKSWDINVEVRNEPKSKSKNNAFTLSAGIWKDYDIDATELRKQAWKMTK